MAEGSVYVASPLGFTASGDRYRREVLTPALVATGLEVLDPWSDPDATMANALSVPAGHPSRAAALEAANREVGARNAALIARAEVVLAILDGADVDSGTAAEVGFASAMRCPVVGLRTDTRTSGDNEAAPVNLQVMHFIEASGGSLHHDLAAALAEVLRCARRDNDRYVYHFADRAEWEEALPSGEYRRSSREASLAEVGFIHASFSRQLEETARRHYDDLPLGSLVLLEIDTTLLSSPLRIDASGSRGDCFPHIYGPLNLDAVVCVRFGRAARRWAVDHRG